MAAKSVFVECPVCEANFKMAASHRALSLPLHSGIKGQCEMSHLRAVDAYPKLFAFLRDGTVHVEGPDYVGTAADGMVVSLGMHSAPAAVESYLNSHPTPESW